MDMMNSTGPTRTILPDVTEQDSANQWAPRLHLHLKAVKETTWPLYGKSCNKSGTSCHVQRQWARAGRPSAFDQWRSKRPLWFCVGLPQQGCAAVAEPSRRVCVSCPVRSRASVRTITLLGPCNFSAILGLGAVSEITEQWNGRLMRRDKRKRGNLSGPTWRDGMGIRFSLFTSSHPSFPQPHWLLCFLSQVFHWFLSLFFLRFGQLFPAKTSAL